MCNPATGLAVAIRHDIPMFLLQQVDHVALTVRDVETSVRWYTEVLGLHRMHEHVWGSFPAVVGIGGTSLALFPVRSDDPASPPGPEAICVRHIAFRADRENFEHARRSLAAKGLEVTVEDHDIAHSIYFVDPDGHQLEITTYDPARQPVDVTRVIPGSDLHRRLQRPFAGRTSAEGTGSEAELSAQFVAEVAVQDLERSIGFYETLGFALRRRDGGFAVLGWNGHLLFLDEDKDLPAPADRLRVNLRILVADVDAVWTLVQNLGIPVTQPIGTRYYGLRDFTIVDPDGFALRFAARAQPDGE